MTDIASSRLPLEENIMRGAQIWVEVDGKQVEAYEGETIAALLTAQNLSALRTTTAGEPRGVYCGMGICFDCLVVVDQIPNTRACMTWAKDGMQVSTQLSFKTKD